MISSLLGQSSDFEFTTTSTSTDTALGAGVLVAYFVFLIAAYVFFGIVLSKIFKKAGHPNPWAAWVPFYNQWALFEISGRPGWWALVSLGGVVPFLGFIASIAAFVLSIIAMIDLSKSFGKGGGFAVLLILLPIVGFPMLAFGDAQYHGAAGPEGDKFKGGGMNGGNTMGGDMNGGAPSGPQAPTPPAEPMA